MKPLSMVLGCCLVIGCGAQDSGLEENSQGKAEVSGHGLTLGQKDIFEIQRNEIQVFTIKVPEGIHAYSMTIRPTEESSFFDYGVESAWTFVGEGEDHQAAVDELGKSLGDCQMDSLDSIDCSASTARARQRNLNIFTGPGRVALALRLTDDSSYKFSIKVNELPPVNSGACGMLVMGWTSASRLTGGEDIDPEVSPIGANQIPLSEAVATLIKDSVLYSGSFQAAVVPFPTEDTPWEYASSLALKGTKLRFGECYTMNIGLNSRLAGCPVFAE